MTFQNYENIDAGKILLAHLFVNVESFKCHNWRVSNIQLMHPHAGELQFRMDLMNDDEYKKVWEFVPAKGNVIFASAFYGWGFTIPALIHRIKKYSNGNHHRYRRHPCQCFHNMP